MRSPSPCGYIMVFVRLPVSFRNNHRLGMRILNSTCKPQMLRIVHILREIMVHIFRCLELSNRNVRQGRQLLSHVCIAHRCVASKTCCVINTALHCLSRTCCAFRSAHAASAYARGATAALLQLRYSVGIDRDCLRCWCAA